MGNTYSIHSKTDVLTKKKPSSSSTASYRQDLRVLARTLASPIVKATDRNMAIIISSLANLLLIENQSE